MNNIKFILLLLIMLSCLGCRQIFGDGVQPESIVQPPTEATQIIVISPAHGSIWKKGDVINIKWIAPTIKNINIQLFKKSAYTFTIAGNIENKGTYEWVIPNDFSLSNHYLIKISNQNNSSVYEFSEMFGIQ